MKKKPVEIDRFHAISDSGNKYIIIEIQEILIDSSMGAPDEEYEGIKKLRTSDGYTVKSIGSSTFEIIQTGEIVRKI